MINSVLLWPISRFVGVAGFEPATSCSQSRRDNRATLHPENSLDDWKFQFLKLQITNHFLK